MVERRSFDAWGKRRNQNGTAMTNAFVTSEVRHAFTGHEDLGELGLIHMNGRLYDPAIGRFLSADPTIQYADDMQNYNRYSYINNNPLSATDPSGYGFFSSIFKGLKKLFKNKVFRIVGQVLATVNGGPAGAALFSAASTYAQTGSLTDALTAGVKTYITAQAFAQIGAPKVDGFDVANIAANAAVGCVTSAASGGKCGAGALSAGFSAGIGNSGWIKDSWGPAANAMARAVVGGTASVLGGGKFENGAATGAFTYLYVYGQMEYSRRYESSIKNEIDESERVAQADLGDDNGDGIPNYRDRDTLGIQSVDAAPIQAIGASSGGGVKMYPPGTKIYTDPRNLIPTEVPSGSVVNRLSTDMKANGYNENYPISATQNSRGRLEVTDGHHRRAAAIKAGVDKVPVVVY